MTCNLRTVNRPSLSFTVCTDCTDRQTVSPPHSESIRRKNILSPLNDMQFTDCQQTVSLVYGLYRPYRPSKCFTPHSESIIRENVLSPLNDMKFTDCQQTVSLVYGLYGPYRTVKLFHPTIRIHNT